MDRNRWLTLILFEWILFGYLIKACYSKIVGTKFFQRGVEILLLGLDSMRKWSVLVSIIIFQFVTHWFQYID